MQKNLRRLILIVKKLFYASLIFFIFTICANAFALSQNDKKRMSSFVSAFTETGFFNFDLENADPDDNEELSEYEEPVTHLGTAANVTELIRFGILHNLIHGRDNLKQCSDKNCESGSLTLDKKIVFDTVKKFFDIDISKKDLSLIKEDPTVVFSYDGKLFHFNEDSFKEPGNDTVYFADVQGVTKRGEYLMFAGDIYNSKQTTNRPGMFAAIVKPVKNSWVIISMTTDWVTNAGRD